MKPNDKAAKMCIIALDWTGLDWTGLDKGYSALFSVRKFDTVIQSRRYLGGFLPFPG